MRSEKTYKVIFSFPTIQLAMSAQEGEHVQQIKKIYIQDGSLVMIIEKISEIDKPSRN